MPRPMDGLLVALGLLASACGHGAQEPQEEVSAKAPHPEITPYVEFLRESAGDPVAYVARLLDDRDLVILCERAHPEATQYELFAELLADERVGGRISAVFTELGGRNLQPELDEILLDRSLPEAEARQRLLRLYRDLTFWPTWDNTNFFDFLLEVRALNRSRPAGREVRVVLADVEFSWQGLDREGYQAFRAGLGGWDRAMAECIIDEVAAMEEGTKALVIMNYRHAFNDFVFDDGRKGNNVGRYLFEAFPGRVANVMLSSLAVQAGSTDEDVHLEPIQGGKWDAAFQLLGVEEAAFDFAGSPFGSDQFDYFPFRTQTVTYEDVFTGFIYYRPLAAHVFRSPVPGFLDEDYRPELRRRLEVAGIELSDEDLAELMAPSPTETRYDTLDAMEARIGQWLGDEG